MAVSEQELIDMKLHDEGDLAEGLTIKRVVGGWIYWAQSGTQDTSSMGLAGVFVPEPKFPPKQN